MNSVNTHNDSQRALDDTAISLLNNPSIPDLWASSDEGEAWEWGNYFAIFQLNPRTFAEGLCERMANTPANLKKLNKKYKNEFRYLYAMTVYYKKGKNPSGVDSARPVKIIALEQSKQFGDWGPVFIGMFTPQCRMNLGTYNGEGNREAVRNLFFSHLIEDSTELPRRFGVIADAFELKTGKPFQKKVSKTGCFGILMFLVLLPVFLVMMTGMITRVFVP